MSRGGSYECDVRKRPSWTFTSLCQWFEGEAWCRHSGSFAQSQTISVLIISRELRWVNAGWATQMPTRWTHLYLFLTCLFASRWCCSLFTHNHRATWQHMLSCSPTDMCSTLLKGEKKKSRLVPELGQMFEINGNFLVFFELGQMRGGKKGKSLSFFIGWAWGVLQLPLLVLLRLFPLTEQKQTLFSIVVFSYSCWEGVGGLSVGILLLWNMVGQDAWAKYLYKHGQQ